ncbi:MAG: hypothetical protein AAB037_05800 [Chloroflexota bacterium]
MYIYHFRNQEALLTGRAIKRLCNRLSLTLDELALRLNYNPEAVERLAEGHIPDVPSKVLINLVDSFFPLRGKKQLLTVEEAVRFLLATNEEQPPDEQLNLRI